MMIAPNGIMWNSKRFLIALPCFVSMSSVQQMIKPHVISPSNAVKHWHFVLFVVFQIWIHTCVHLLLYITVAAYSSEFGNPITDDIKKISLLVRADLKVWSVKHLFMTRKRVLCSGLIFRQKAISEQFGKCFCSPWCCLYVTGSRVLLF